MNVSNGLTRETELQRVIYNEGLLWGLDLKAVP